METTWLFLCWLRFGRYEKKAAFHLHRMRALRSTQLSTSGAHGERNIADNGPSLQPGRRRRGAGDACTGSQADEALPGQPAGECKAQNEQRIGRGGQQHGRPFSMIFFCSLQPYKEHVKNMRYALCPPMLRGVVRRRLAVRKLRQRLFSSSPMPPPLPRHPPADAADPFPPSFVIRRPRVAARGRLDRRTQREEKTAPGAEVVCAAGWIRRICRRTTIRLSVIRTESGDDGDGKAAHPSPRR